MLALTSIKLYIYQQKNIIMKRIITLFLLLSTLIVTAQQRVDKMEWFRNAKFGMFIHWGVYSQIAGEWEGKSGYSEFVMLNAKIPLKEYEKVASTLYPVNFDAEKWVKAAKEAGMKYLVYTSKHHEGFAMYHSRVCKYNIYDHTSFKRDPLKELADACRKYGVKLGIYYSLGRDWQDPDVPTDWPTKGGRSNTWDYPNEDAKDINKYLERKAKPQIRELLEMYNPDMIWFDTPELTPAFQSKAIRKMILDYNPNIIINSRIGNGQGDFENIEQKQSEKIINGDWEACITMSKNWGYMKADHDFKSPEKLVSMLVDIASKGGNLLLNVGPTPTGELREENLSRMATIGRWLNDNGEAIYGTKAWKTYGEEEISQKSVKVKTIKGLEDEVYDATEDLNSDIRFTCKNNCVYVIARNWYDRKVIVKSMAEGKINIKSISLLRSSQKIDWNQTPSHLEMDLPLEVNDPLHIYVFKVELR